MIFTRYLETLVFDALEIKKGLEVGEDTIVCEQLRILVW